MLANHTYHKYQLRELASMVSHAAFKKLASSSNQSSYIRRMKKYVGWNEMTEDRPSQLSDLIAYSYQLLEQHYRHEYIYKNKLLNDFVLKYYSLKDSIFLNEFKIGGSIADAVLINGSDKVFEIKTELDNAERLSTQLEDYYKAFSQVYIFTHHTLSSYYLELLPTYVGLLTFDHTGQVQVSREADSRIDTLELTAMMASLRKPEYITLTSKVSGSVPSATPAFLYRSCLATLAEYPIADVQRAYFEVLKSRNDTFSIDFYESDIFPSCLHFSIYQQQLNKNSYLTLVNNLNKNL